MNKPCHPPRHDFAAATAPLDQAMSLPADAYTSPEIYAQEMSRVFRASWLCAGRVDQVPEPGSYKAVDLLGDKLVIVRGKDNIIRVLSRVCRHRAAELVNGEGRCGALVCPYHAWTYRLDGTLHGAPLMDGAADFDPAEHPLPEIRSEVWQGWIFVNFDGAAPPLGAQLAPLDSVLENYDLTSMVALEPQVYDSPFNWKVLVDNFMEAYHHIAIHSDTFEPIFPARNSEIPDNDGPYAVLRMPLKPGIEPGSALPALPETPRVTDVERTQLLAAVVFPCHLFAPTVESLTWYHVLPVSAERFELRIYSCLPKSTLDDDTYKDAIDGLRGFVDHIHRQDIAGCEAVWQGLNSASVAPGRLSPLEKTLWQFNQWWVARLGAG